jgi:hypothetical protein
MISFSLPLALAGACGVDEDDDEEEEEDGLAPPVLGRAFS